MLRRTWSCLVLVLLTSGALAQSTSAQSNLAQSKPTKPVLPPGAPTKGFAVAVIADGVDYTRPTVAAKFARDGEGDAIAYDAVDDDRKPHGTSVHTAGLIEMAQTFIVPIRVDASRPETWQRAFAFLRRSPARVVVILALPPTDAWDALHAAIKATPDRLFILPADPTRPKLALDHALTVAALPAPTAASTDLILAPATATREAPGSPNAPPNRADEAAMLAAGLFTCSDVSAARSPAAVKALFIAKAARAANDAPRLLEVCR